MKVCRFLSVVFSLAVLVYCFGVTSAVAGTRSVLFIDADKILGEALVAKDIRSQLDRRRAELQGSFSSREERLRREEEDLIKQKSILSSEAFEAKVAEFKKSVESLNRDASVRMSELEGMFSNAMGQVYEKIQQISKRIAEENSSEIVLFMSKGQASYINSDADISEKVLEILNKDLSRVSLSE